MSKSARRKRSRLENYTTRWTEAVEDNSRTFVASRSDCEHEDQWFIVDSGASLNPPSARTHEILDTRASHAMACMSGGDAVRLHNELRDAVFVKCMAAGIQGRREQAELLPDDPRRRPGDIYIPQWPGGQGIAMDFAVTSPLQIALVQASAERPLAAARAYEERKFADRQTAQRCLNHGVRLVPLVAESTSGWGPEAQKAFKVIARSISSATGAAARPRRRANVREPQR